MRACEVRWLTGGAGGVRAATLNGMRLRERLNSWSVRVWLDAGRTLGGGTGAADAQTERWVRPGSAQGERLGRVYGALMPVFCLVVWLAGGAWWQVLLGGPLVAFCAMWCHLALWNAARALRRS